MLTLTHAISGGAIGQRVDNIYLAFFLGVVLHFILDKIPHFWPEQKKWKTLMMGIDMMLCLGFLLFANIFVTKNISSFLAGAIGGIVVDILLVLTPIYYMKIGKWHSKRQHHMQNKWYYLTDAVLIIIFLTVIYFSK